MKKIILSNGGFITIHFLNKTPAPMLLIFPGGGYNHICENEAENLVPHFQSRNFHCAVLHYRVAPERAPAPQIDAYEAVRLMRQNAELWGINKIAVCGFSAGGHLAACCGCLAPEDAIPDAMILAYPVISTGKFANRETIDFLLGKDASEQELQKYSLELHVHDFTPPTFCFHTLDDAIVPVENTILFTEAMHRNCRCCESHVFAHGRHGLNLAQGILGVELWPYLAEEFLIGQVGFNMPANP